MVELIIFDLDGTLVESHTTNLLPGVWDFFQKVIQLGPGSRPALAIATNQGGVGMRYWMEQQHFGSPERYPTEAEIIERLDWLTAELGQGQKIAVYVCFRYKDRTGKNSPIPPGKTGDPRWSAEWRKPAPGMLLQAMRDAGASPGQTLFVGNGSADEGAARAAGCTFEWASGFFTRDWSSSKTMEGIMQ